MAPLVRTGGSRHTGLAALPHCNIQSMAAAMEPAVCQYMVNNPSGPKSMPPILGGNRFIDF